MSIPEFTAYITGQFTLIGQSLVLIVKTIINIATVSFDFISQLLKLVVG